MNIITKLENKPKEMPGYLKKFSAWIFFQYFTLHLRSMFLLIKGREFKNHFNQKQTREAWRES